MFNLHSCSFNQELDGAEVSAIWYSSEKYQF